MVCPWKFGPSHANWKDSQWYFNTCKEVFSLNLCLLPAFPHILVPTWNLSLTGWWGYLLRHRYALARVLQLTHFHAHRPQLLCSSVSLKLGATQSLHSSISVTSSWLRISCTLKSSHYYTTGREIIAKILWKLTGTQERHTKIWTPPLWLWFFLLTQRYNCSEIHHGCRVWAVESLVLLAQCAHAIN